RLLRSAYGALFREFRLLAKGGEEGRAERGDGGEEGVGRVRVRETDGEGERGIEWVVEGRGWGVVGGGLAGKEGLGAAEGGMRGEGRMVRGVEEARDGLAGTKVREFVGGEERGREERDKGGSWEDGVDGGVGMRRRDGGAGGDYGKGKRKAREGEGERDEGDETRAVGAGSKRRRGEEGGGEREGEGSRELEGKEMEEAKRKEEGFGGERRTGGRETLGGEAREQHHQQQQVQQGRGDSGMGKGEPARDAFAVLMGRGRKRRADHQLRVDAEAASDVLPEAKRQARDAEMIAGIGTVPPLPPTIAPAPTTDLFTPPAENLAAEALPATAAPDTPSAAAPAAAAAVPATGGAAGTEVPGVATSSAAAASAAAAGAARKMAAWDRGHPRGRGRGIAWIHSTSNPPWPWMLAEAADPTTQMVQEIRMPTGDGGDGGGGGAAAAAAPASAVQVKAAAAAAGKRGATAAEVRAEADARAVALARAVAEAAGKEAFDPAGRPEGTMIAQAPSPTTVMSFTTSTTPSSDTGTASTSAGADSTSARADSTSAGGERGFWSRGDSSAAAAAAAVATGATSEGWGVGGSYGRGSMRREGRSDGVEREGRRREGDGGELGVRMGAEELAGREMGAMREMGMDERVDAAADAYGGEEAEGAVRLNRDGSRGSDYIASLVAPPAATEDVPSVVDSPPAAQVPSVDPQVVPTERQVPLADAQVPLSATGHSTAPPRPTSGPASVSRPPTRAQAGAQARAEAGAQGRAQAGACSEVQAGRQQERRGWAMQVGGQGSSPLACGWAGEGQHFDRILIGWQRKRGETGGWAGVEM
ncbi:unnamed protein product, partial [Closterium sp. NIES-53]